MLSRRDVSRHAGIKKSTTGNFHSFKSNQKLAFTFTGGWQARQCRRDALKEADLIILCGSVCDFRLSYGRVFPRKTPIIAVNRNKDQLFRVLETITPYICDVMLKSFFVSLEFGYVLESCRVCPVRRGNLPS